MQAFAHPVLFPGADVLPGKCPDRVPEGSPGHLHQALEPGCRVVSGHKDKAESVHNPLQDQSAHRDDHILECDGNSQADQPHRHPAVRPEVLPFRVEQIQPADCAETDQRRDHLGDDCCARPSVDPHMAGPHKEPIQHHIDHGCNRQRGQRGTAVSQRVQETVQHIDRHHNRQPAVDDAEVSLRQGKRFRRGIHPSQHRGKKQLAGNLQQHRDGRCDQDALPYRPAQFFRPVRTKILRRLDGKSLGQAHGNGEYRPVQPSGRGYRRQGCNAQELADDE